MPGKALIVAFDEQHAPEIRRIRHAVFTQEQAIDKDLDFDGQDSQAVHVLVRKENRFVAAGRMLDDGHIGRLAVLREHRGQGLGAQAVEALVQEARRLGMTRVYLGSQKHAVGFYEKLGFSERGEPFMEAGIEHVEMEKVII
jgi:predicted GNAT family N-acyltransferase